MASPFLGTTGEYLGRAKTQNPIIIIPCEVFCCGGGEPLRNFQVSLTMAFGSRSHGDGGGGGGGGLQWDNVFDVF